jgi:hypothetical protein
MGASIDIGGSIVMGLPIAGCFMMENPMKMDDAGYPHDFGNLHNMVNQC